ncbi:telomere length and silencing protein 1 homolog [Rhipicephalus sanguineus]|uniref:telomere length and silencing protein 1 homolog n=1 Tax=Rhipicephalus sanguineus TaxID=34632 RepID=UPI00189444BD|nr:telomere length and silencing protein 1 homolog [Rhipicephalus sanguineus]
MAGDACVAFKSGLKKRKCFRQHKSSDCSESDGEEDVSREILQDTKEIQKLRKRPNGVSVIGLNLGKKLTPKEELVIDDPFKLKTGGMIDMKALKGKRVTMEELDAVNLGNTFSVETNQRDEDADMMKYIEEELAKRRGRVQEPQPTPRNTVDEKDVLFHVPEHLRKSTSKKSEEMLSNQMLSGIPEVDLGIEERIRNIEATEEAKLKLIRDRMARKERETSFVPTNMAVNFVQHNRFNIDDGNRTRHLRRPVREKEPPPPKPVVVIAEAEGVADQIPGRQGRGGKGSSRSRGNDDEKATDDFHFEKFKKQFRRY